MATVWNLKQAIQVFKDKRGTNQFYEDCNIRTRKANQSEETAELEIRKMHKRIDVTLKEVAAAKEEVTTSREKNSSQQTATSSGRTQATGLTLSGANYHNASLFVPTTLKYQGVSLVALNYHIHKVEKWLRVAFNNKRIPQE